jgi:hypothetical protein
MEPSTLRAFTAKSRLWMPAALAVALCAAAAAWRRRMRQAGPPRRQARLQTRALQTWEGEGGALPTGTQAPAGAALKQPETALAATAPVRRRVRAGR